MTGEVIGRATGGNFGFRVGMSLALGMVRPEFPRKRVKALEIEILGRNPTRRASFRTVRSIPENHRLRTGSDADG